MDNKSRKDNRNCFFRYGIDYQNHYFLETDLPDEIQDFESAFYYAYELFKNDYENWFDSVKYYISRYINNSGYYSVFTYDSTYAFTEKYKNEVNKNV